MDEFRNYEYEEEIDLKQLLVYVLRKWRVMLAAAVVLGLLLGGAKMAKGFLDLQDPEKVEESIKEAELAQENYNTAKAQLANQMAEYNRQLDDYQRYAENSLYMKIDPYAVYQESITYAVTTDYQILPNMTYQTLNWMGPVLSAYSSVATSVTLSDLPPEGRAGLSGEWDADSLDKLIKVETSTNDGRLTITASAESDFRSKAILQAVKNKIEASQAGVAESVGEHKLSVITEKSAVTVDETMINDRETMLRNITLLREAADKAIEKYNKLNAPGIVALSPESLLKSGIKFGILGAVVAVFMVCFWFGVAYLLDDVLHDSKPIRNRFKARVLSVFSSKDKKNIIDRILDRIQGVSCPADSRMLALHTAAATLENADTKNILVSGTADPSIIRTIDENLSEMISNASVRYKGDFLKDIKALEELKTVDSVLLVEKIDSSHLTDIQREIDVIHHLGKNLEGFILIRE